METISLPELDLFGNPFHQSIQIDLDGQPVVTQTI
jgi:hypothetical protein